MWRKTYFVEGVYSIEKDRGGEKSLKPLNR